VASIAIGRPKQYNYFNVFLNGKLIDTVTYSVDSQMTSDEVRRSLIEHDGMDKNILVRMER
jgi:hypothetical protein